MLSTEQKSTQLYKHFLNVSDTRDNRDFYEEAIQSSFCVRPDQLLKYGDKIPRGESETAIETIRNLKDGETFDYAVDENEKVPIIKFYKDYPLTMVDKGTDNAFKLVDTETKQPIKNIIPFNYYKDVYNYDLRTNAKNGSKKIYFGVGDWVLDVFSGVLKFYGDVPKGVNHENPPTISFYQYVGGTGFRTDAIGYEGIILPVKDWYISKDSYLLNAEYNGITLETKIAQAADIIQTGYAEIYGFDGANKNEGIAYSLDTITALTYTSNKDAVKGYDESSDSDIGVLLSNTTASIKSDFAKITFCSQNVPYTDNATTHKITIKEGLISFDDGEAVTIKDITKVSDSYGNFIIIEGASKIDNGDYTVVVEKGTSTGLLLYWNKIEHEYLPYISNEDNNFNFGVPVVAAIGRIPPSVSIGSISLNDFSDSITPDYYGPRNYTVTVALQDESNAKSADYVVKNYKGYYLNDIINKIASDYTENGTVNFKGTIFLRAGTYEIDNDAIDLSKFNNLVLKGEDKNTTIIKGNIYVESDKVGHIIINDITVDNIEFKSNVSVLTTNEVIANSISLTKGDNLSFIKNTSITDLSIADTGIRSENNSDVLGKVWNYVEGNILGTVKSETGHTFYNGNTIATLTLTDVNMDLVKDCFIQKVISKPSQTQLIGCTVFTYEETPFSEIPHMKHFPIYSKESDMCIEYATFANPLEITYDSENGNTVSLKYDDSNFYVDEEKGLCCSVHADQINVDIENFNRHSSYEGKAPVDALPNKNVQEALDDLYNTKADLNPDGKVPLEELPDSVAYGGLLYVGIHTFEYIDTDNGKEEENYYVDGGAYPTYEDASLSLSKDKTQKDKDGNDMMQPGWFWIVGPSKKDEDKPATIQKAALQEGEESPLEFTAGDWVIWNGKNFEKLDRAYQDVAYMVLPIYTTGEHLHWSWEEADDNNTKWGLGALKLGGVTIAEGFDMINQELLKLRVKHPGLLRDIALVPYYDDYKTVDYYKINNNNVSTILSSAYDLLKDERVSSFRVKTPKTDKPYESAVYVGNETTFDIVVDDEHKTIVYRPTSELLTDGVHFDAVFDPYANEIVGKGFWNATYVDFGGENLDDGSHRFVLGITDIKPKDTFNAISYTPMFGIDTVNRLDYSVEGACKASIADIATINGNDIKKAEVAGYCSGIPTISNSIDLVLNFTVYDAIDSININRVPLQIVDENTNTITDIPVSSSITLFKNDENSNLYSINVKDFSYSLPKNKCSVGQNISVNALDIYGNSSKVENLLNLNVVYADGLSEKERVCSGNGLYPSVNPSIENACGSDYLSYKSLADEYTNELMKSARMVNDEIVYEYAWPNGKYDTYDNTIDYTDITTGNDISEDESGNIYRWATITKSWNGENFEDVVLNETSGFTLNINVSSDIDEILSQDEFDMTTKSDELIIQGKVVDYSKDNEISVTNWFNCNLPYSGYDEVGTENGQGAMYAGTSTKLSKRITFGQKVYSGNLIFRIGLKAGSNIRIQSLTVKDLI